MAKSLTNCLFLYSEMVRKREGIIWSNSWAIPSNNTQDLCTYKHWRNERNVPYRSFLAPEVYCLFPKQCLRNDVLSWVKVIIWFPWQALMKIKLGFYCCLLYHSFIFEIISCFPRWHRTFYLVENDLEVLILFSSPQCWDCRCALPCPVFIGVFNLELHIY